MTATLGPAAIVARGARVNALGALARVVQPVAFALLTRWYGPEAMGVYLLAVAALETLAALASSGLQDGVVAFVSPLPPGSGEADRQVAGALVLGAGAAIAAAAVAAGAALLAPAWLPQDGAGATLWRLAPSLPLLAFVGIAVAATRARFVQTYDVMLQGAAKPALVILFAWWFAPLKAGATALAWAYVLAHVVLAALSALALSRYFSWPRLAASMRVPSIDRRLLAFALPQNLNLALHSLTGGASILALGVAGLPPGQIALFAAALSIASSLRHVRMVFSSALAPVVAALYAHGERGELREVLSRTAEWSVSIAVPVALFIVAFRSELLRLFHPSYEAGAATMWLLVTAPLVNTVGGFASNALVMAGFVRWNLANTVVAVVASFGLTWLLAPPFGFTGAAVAAAAAGVVVATLQLTEASVLMGVAPSPGSVVRPALAGTGAWLAWIVVSGSRPGFGFRVASAMLALLVYGAILWWGRRVVLHRTVP